ncbi:hypothetical protein ACLOJK_011025 [Asimina triloba]
MAIELKLLIDKGRKRVAYAESDKYFVETIFSFLTKTVGNVVRLSNKKSNLGSMDALYESVENLDFQYFQTKVVKDMLLHPRSASETRTEDLPANIDTDHPKYYICTWTCVISGSRLISSVKNARCHCGTEMSEEIYLKKSAPSVEPGEEGVFVKGNMRFMITDDLLVQLVSVTTCFTHLSKLGVSNWTSLGAKSVKIGAEELSQLSYMDLVTTNQHVDKFNLMNAGFVGKAFCLLKQSLVSNTPLTDVFLPELGDSEHAANVNPSFQDATTEIKDNSEKMRIKLMLSKSKNKVLFAEVNADIVDLLFSFLTFPLGSIVKLLGLSSSIGCLDNLYKSVDDLSREDGCMVSEESSTTLLEPKLALHWQCESQILSVMEEGPKVNWINPKISGGTSECGGGFVKGPKTAFMVTDGLDVKPMSLISGISILENFDVPLSDLQERDVSVGEAEALSLLRASLSSKTVFSDPARRPQSPPPNRPSPTLPTDYQRLSTDFQLHRRLTCSPAAVASKQSSRHRLLPAPSSSRHSPAVQQQPVPPSSCHSPAVQQQPAPPSSRHSPAIQQQPAPPSSRHSPAVQQQPAPPSSHHSPAIQQQPAAPDTSEAARSLGLSACCCSSTAGHHP